LRRGYGVSIVRKSDCGVVQSTGIQVLATTDEAVVPPLDCSEQRRLRG
jgi:hypothetical protein